MVVLSGSESMQDFVSSVYICIAVDQEDEGIPLTALPSPHFCACPKPGAGFPTSYIYINIYTYIYV